MIGSQEPPTNMSGLGRDEIRPESITIWIPQLPLS